MRWLRARIAWSGVPPRPSTRVADRVRALSTLSGTGRPAGGARRDSFKGRHIAGNPWVSLACISDLAQPLYIDCQAAWADELAEKQHAWDLFLRIPPPAGYDPGPIYVAPDHPNFGLLKLAP